MKISRFRSAPRLPAGWEDRLNALLDDYPFAEIRRFAELEGAWTQLWDPLLDKTCADTAHWSPTTLDWSV